MGRHDDSILRKNKERHVSDTFLSKKVTYLLSALKGTLLRGIYEVKRGVFSGCIVKNLGVTVISTVHIFHIVLSRDFLKEAH